MAYELLIKSHCTRLPVESIRIAKQLQYIIMTYDKLIERFPSLDFDSLIDRYGNAIILNLFGNYHIYVNTRNGYFDANWAVMHEIGHALLGHVKRHGQIRGESYAEKHRFTPSELAADEFASMALCPDIILDAMHWTNDTEFIKFACIVPDNQASEKSYYLNKEYIKAKQKNNYLQFQASEDQLLSLFSGYINKYGRRVEIAEEFYIDFSGLRKIGA